MQDIQYRMEQYYKKIEEELAVVKAERDELASVLNNVANKLIEEKRIVKGLLDAILEHIGASIEYERELSDDWL
jgi:thiamine phosphate synthase YjbQ (UPF0047 family)